MATKEKAPWKKPAPKKSRHTKLSKKSKAGAKAAAKRAGGKYPSLVDNMNAAKKQRSRGTKSREQAVKARTKDPKGGLTAEGRAVFRRKEGAHLRPGVKKAKREMTLEECAERAAGPRVSTAAKSFRRLETIRVSQHVSR